MTLTSIEIVTITSLLDYCEIFIDDTEDCLRNETNAQEIKFLAHELSKVKATVVELQKFATNHVLTQDEKQHHLTLLKLTEDKLTEYFLFDQ